jgi:hypothetical protein
MKVKTADIVRDARVLAGLDVDMKVKRTGNHLRAARALAGVDQEYVARLAEVAIGTVRNMEGCGFGPITSRGTIVERVFKALETLGIQFVAEIDEDGVTRIVGVKRHRLITGVGFSAVDYKPEIGLVDERRGHVSNLPIPVAKEMAVAARERGDIEYAVELEAAIRLAASMKNGVQNGGGVR